MASELYNFDFDFLKELPNSELEILLKQISDRHDNLFQSTVMEFDPRQLADKEKTLSRYINHFKLAIHNILRERREKGHRDMRKSDTFDGGKRKARKSRGRRRRGRKVGRTRRGGANKSRRRRSTRRRR